MVFSSDPIYLDPPNSWPQQQGATCETPQVPPPPRLLHGSGDGGGGGSGSSIKPRSMAERARLAKIPQPEAALKCPRCESNNTKFCYFNNYSLSQPRHFCKTCRRYWTRGGALRNVPVGGGCRRNKGIKGKGSRSKSPAKAAGCSSSSGLTSNSCPNDIIGHMAPPPLQVPILPPLQSLGDYNSTEIGLNFTRIQPPTTINGGGMEFNIGSTSSSASGGGVVGSNLSNGLVDQWRLQQIPLFANLEMQSGGLYQFGGQGIDHHSQNYFCQHRSNKPLDTLVTQLATVKLEANQALNLSRSVMGIAGIDQYWGANAWSTAELPGFTSSSTSNLL